ncbi:MAG: diguanylate cyclase [Lachnospiraceae bacterium]|nr:diguanylate cyclase [Lachnospiraceae bacterium]
MKEIKVVALCTSRIYDPQVHDYIEKLNEDLKKDGYVLMVFTINSDLYWEDANISAETSVFDILPYQSAKAVVIMDEKIKNHSVAEKIIAKSKEYGKPVIVVDGEYEGTSSIKFDYAAGFEKVVEHVFEMRQIRKPHIMAGIPDNPFSDERIEIFKKVIQRHGLVFDEFMLSYGQFWARPAIEAAEKLIAGGEIPDVIVCANDIMAINVSDVLKKHGIRVPQDCMVTGFDGYDEVFLTEPKITTASCTTPELAEATAAMIRKAGEGTCGSISVVPVFIANESTGAPAFSGYDKSILGKFNNKFYRHQDEAHIMHEVTTRMQMSKDTDEMVSYLKRLIINDQNMVEDVSFVLNRRILDTDTYFFNGAEDKIDPTEYTLVYDAEKGSVLVEREVDETLLRAENKRFAEKAEKGYPLIFNTIDYMDRTMGYICFAYNSYDITDYSRTANLSNTIGMGVGGYVNMKYQRRLAERIDAMYKKDPLTGLYNRVGFSNAFELVVDAKEHIGEPVTVLMSDLDGLKYINDNFGHAEGDNAIATAAAALKDSCPEDALCVRFGGDELFAVIVGEHDVNEITGKILKYLNDYNASSGRDYTVMSSLGANTTVFDENFDIKEALRLADEQMYELKKVHHKI